MSMQLPAAMTPASQRAALGNFTWVNLLKHIGIITALVAVNKAGLPGNIVFYCIVCAWATTSTENALKALSVALFALVANTYFVEKSVAFSVGRFAILAVCAGRIFVDLRAMGWFQQYRAPVMALAVFIALAAAMSYITKYFLLISLLKLANFAIGAFVIIGGVEVVRRRAGEITCWMVAMCSVVVALGLAAMALGQGSNFRGDGMTQSFFNGPFYHSQTLGPLGAMMIVYLGAIACFTAYRLRFLAWPLIAVLFYFVFLTQSRTAVAACMFGLGVLGLTAFVFSRRKGLRVRFNISLGTMVAAGFVGLLLFLLAFARSGSDVFARITDFVVKHEAGLRVGMEDVLASRQGQIDMMMFNIERAPLTGIGFGTSIHPYFIENATIFSAPTEKGNIVLAVAEETGIPTAIAFWVFVYIFFRSFWRSLNAPAIAVFATFLAVNLGEMMFFSFGGHGAFGWLIVGAAMALGDRCLLMPPPPRAGETPP